MRKLLILILFLLPIISFGQIYNVTIKSENGNVSQTGFIDEKGEKEGKWTSYTPDGHICSIGFYKDNLKVGKWETYKSKGILWSEITYNNGKKVHGKIYGNNGEVIEERCF